MSSIDTLIYWTGAGVWLGAALYALAYLVIPLLETVSYFYVAVRASMRHQRKINWVALPRAFITNWWKWMLYGAPTTISGPYMTWEGPFKWRITPIAARTHQEPQA